MRISLVACVVVAALLGCAKQDPPVRDTELRDAIAAYRTALNSGDSVSFFGFLAAEIEVLAPGMKPVQGAGARDLFRPLFTQVKPELAPFTNEELTISGDLAVQRYTYQLTTTPRSGGKATTEAGSGLHVWKRMPDGRWQVVKDIWTNPSGS